MQQVDDFKACFDVAAAGGRIFFRTIDSVICWDASKAAKAWEVVLDGDRIGGKKEVQVHGDLVLTVNYDDPANCKLVAIELTGGQVRWAIPLGIWPDAGCMIVVNGLVCCYGGDSVGGLKLVQCAIANGDLVQVLSAPVAQTLFADGDRLLLAGTDGIFELVKNEIIQIGTTAVLGYRLWHSMHFMIVWDSQSETGGSLAIYDANTGALGPAWGLGSEEGHRWEMDAQQSEMLVVRNTANHAMLLVTHSEEGFEVNMMAENGEYGLVRAAKCLGGLYFLAESKSNKKYHVVRLNGGIEAGIVELVPQIKFARYLSEVRGSLLTAGLSGIRIWSQQDLD